MTRLRVGMIGAGNISGQYLSLLPRLRTLELVAVSDLSPTAAAAAVERHGLDVPVLAPEALLARDDVDVVLNLTIPAAHVEVSKAALAAGKHVYVEKPIGLDVGGARDLLDNAAGRGLVVGVAPDTILGTGVQTARAAVEDGLVGRPIAATAFMTTPGHELWHPHPDFYYAAGGGPLMDMGPYYLTALVHLLGPVARVNAMVARPRTARTIATGPRAGQEIAVDVATHETALLEHVDGAVSTILLSFDVWESTLPRIELYGSRGSLSVPDPNGFDGDVRIATSQDRRWRTVPPLAGFVEAGRGVGLADLSRSVRTASDARASGEIALHVLEVVEAVHLAAASGAAVGIVSRPQPPAIVPLGGVPGVD